jgi:hypothetical protein
MAYKMFLPILVRNFSVSSGIIWSRLVSVSLLYHNCLVVLLHGTAWHCLALLGTAWHCLALLATAGTAWHCLALHRTAWQYLALLGTAP